MSNDAKVEHAEELQMKQFLTYRLARVQAKLNAQATRILKDKSGLSLAQWRVIALIASFGPERAAVLTSLAEIDKGLFSRKLKTLVEDGLVLAESDPTDNRRQMLRLSASGQALFEKTLPHMQKRQAALRDALTPNELASLFSACDKLERILERPCL
ncbi:Transcriptional regulator, MarR family [Candidatus Rhodobacter oscarellae]|uniref:Transcriptional regulator, MarR family n=1 Tax=Candidatus Rhodobacter oscarellae TaxID=1675527 RepID=A0A0J9E3C9_9RHOB|nr:MarR family winged helix-turn-helix transcriptional regulator [Candidatus Rhodobacter lobularis]KMW56329.1 Transcriptional regulator, MarR family [Candidatus Rhodobacter lobularis]